MQVVTELSVEKSARKAVNAGVEQLKKRLMSVEGQNIQLLPNSDYLIHERYYVKNEFFFVYKLKAQDCQTRLLLWLDQKHQTVVLIAYLIKKKTKMKYYQDFGHYAETFYHTHICGLPD